MVQNYKKNKNAGDAASASLNDRVLNQMLDSASNAGSSQYQHFGGARVNNRQESKRELDPFDDDAGSFYAGGRPIDQNDDSSFNNHRQATRQRKLLDFDDDLSDNSNGNNQRTGIAVNNRRRDDDEFSN